MKTAMVDEFGELPYCADVPEPEPASDAVIGTVRAAAIKNIDRMLAAGTHYGSSGLSMPARLGIDGVVELPDGRRVYAGAAPPAGAMAEYLAVDPTQVLDVPDGVDDASAAALPNAAVSAWVGLEYAGRIAAGQNVLVLGATGVTGGLAATLAKHRFAAGRVVAVGRNRERLARIGEQGAGDAIALDEHTDLADAVAQAHHEDPFDLVIDYLWGAPAEQTLRGLAGNDLAAEFRSTRYVQIGEMAGPTISLDGGTLRSAGIELVGQGGGSVPKEAFARIGTEILPELFAMLADGRIAIETAVRPLDDVAAAWQETPPSGVRTVLRP